MPWNWELAKWPNFHYTPSQIAKQERQFLLSSGSEIAFLKNIGKQNYYQFAVEIMTLEGSESSRIEGEILDRESLQSSIKQHFGLKAPPIERSNKETGMADLLCDVYESYSQPLTHEMLWHWHSLLFHEQNHISDRGRYRIHAEPMQIVSSKYGDRIFFEAPPSSRILSEMDKFIQWFNSSKADEPILGRAAIAHVYFESIHPFEDGNGRIGRLLVEKVLSQGIDRPVLVAVSKELERRKKEYYAALERCNKTLEVDHWVDFFADAILKAQEESLGLLHFLIAKSKMLSTFSEKLNSRQEKCLLRMFSEGPEGFTGGLSAEKYIAITKASRATATRDLSDLVEMGALIKTGELRHTRYWLNLSS